MEAFTICKKQWLTLLLISAITAAIGYCLSVFLLGGLLLGVVLMSVVNPLILIGGIFAALVLFSYLMVVLGGVMLCAVSDTGQGFFASLGWAFKHSLSMWWLYILFFLLIAGGFSLLIIPGVFFLVWFSLAPFAYATEGDKGFSAYFKSKDYVHGHFWSVVLRLVPPLLIFVGIYLLPIDQLIKSALYFLLNPFLLAYMQSLYLSAKAVRAQSTATPQKESRTAYFLVGLIGLALPTIILIFLNNARNNADSALSQLQASQEQLNQSLLQALNGTSSNPVAVTTYSSPTFTNVNTDYNSWSTFTYTSPTNTFPSFSIKYPSYLGKPTVDDSLVVTNSTPDFHFESVLTLNFSISNNSATSSYFETNPHIQFENWLYPPLVPALSTLSLDSFATGFYTAANGDGHVYRFSVNGHNAAGTRDVTDLHGADYMVDISTANTPDIFEVSMLGPAKMTHNTDTNGLTDGDKIVQSIQFTTAGGSK